MVGGGVVAVVIAIVSRWHYEAALPSNVNGAAGHWGEWDEIEQKKCQEKESGRA